MVKSVCPNIRGSPFYLIPVFGGNSLIFPCGISTRLAASYLVRSIGLIRPIVKSGGKVGVALAIYRGAAKIWGSSFIISAMNEASNFKFGLELGFKPGLIAKLHQQEKHGSGIAIGDSRIYVFSYGWSIFGTPLGVTKAHHKITSRGISGGDNRSTLPIGT